MMPFSANADMFADAQASCAAFACSDANFIMIILDAGLLLASILIILLAAVKKNSTPAVPIAPHPSAF